MSAIARKKRMTGLLGVGLEDAITVNVNVKPEGTDAPAEDEIVVDEAAKDAEDTTDTVDELDDTAATLESIADDLIMFVQDGGMSPQTARVMNGRISDVYNRVGFAPTALPGLESYGGGSDRLQNTQVGLEDVKEKLMQIWQAIKNGILAAIKAAADLFAKIFGGFTKVKARAAELDKAASGLGSKKAEGKIKLMSAGKLSIDGKVSAETIIKGLDNTKKAAQYVVGEYVDRSAKMLEVLITEAKMGVAQSDEEKLKVRAEAVGSNMDKEFDSFTLPTEEIIGGYYLAVGDGKEGDKSSAVVAASLQKKDGAAVAEDQEIDPLTAEQIKTVLSEVVAVSDLMEKRKDALNKLREETDKMVGAVDAVMKGADKNPAARLYYRSIGRLAARPVLRLPNQYSAYTFKVARSALAACERSIAAYK